MARAAKMQKLFLDLYGVHTEVEVDEVLARHGDLIEKQCSWRPLGDNDSNFGIIQNQQGQPVAALVEKLTNAIDAVLMRRCLEEGIDPKGKNAPKNMQAAVRKFFQKSLWKDKALYDRQAHDIQLLADGPKSDTSLTIYDNGEGQEPDDFPDTFLSLIRGNKKDIPFVQGLYNMGGTGAIVFCGQQKYQLIGSRRYHGKGDFGFTLIRRHPLSSKDEASKQATWYEYLVYQGQVPRFGMSQPLDLDLKGRRFDTGTVVKLYSYQLPSGVKTNIAAELYQSISELLIEPALPIWIADREHRYPKTYVLERALRGIRRDLDKKSNKLIDRDFSFRESTGFGDIAVECYVFKARTGDKSFKESRESLRRQFFKNGGSVLFDVNGQVHGTWSSEFISRSLKMSLLKDHVLILVDCSLVKTAFRNDLFMASRDRMIHSEQSRQLREVLKSLLGKSELRDIYEQRKQSLGVESGEATRAIKNYIKALTFKPELHKLLAGQLDLDEVSSLLGGGQSDSGRKRPMEPRTKQEQQEAEPEPSFQGKRFPSFFRLARPTGNHDATPAARIPLSGSRTVKFMTDAEDEYFRRTDKPGELDIGLLSYKNKLAGTEKSSSTKRGARRYELSDLVHVERSGPKHGEIILRLTPKKEARIGDLIQIQARLFDEQTEHHEWFWVRIVADKEKTKSKPGEDDKGALPGLPDAVLVGRERRDGSDIQHTWDECEPLTNQAIDENTVVYPIMDGDRIEKIIINMDSKVLASQRAESPNADETQVHLMNNRYIASVYLHTLLLGGGIASRGYTLKRPDRTQVNRDGEDVDIAEFLSVLFSDGYAEFLLRFELKEMLEALGE